MDQQTISPKTFWQRPEGKTGTIIGLGILAGGAVLLYKILPFLLLLLQTHFILPVFCWF